MKKIYETFIEMAEDFKHGEYITHQLSDHSTDICEVWQESIMEFARALDGAGIKLPDDPDTYEKFWENATNGLKKWRAGINRRQPFSKCLGTISPEEAKARYGVEGVSRLIVPSFSNGEIANDYYEVGTQHIEITDIDVTTYEK